jgi:hypothetical protein
MTSRITLYSHRNLSPLVELHGYPTTPRSWLLDKNGKSDPGRAEFAVSLWDPKVLEHNFLYGNMVHIQHIPSREYYLGIVPGPIRGQLPDWCGIVMTPRPWDLGYINVVAYSAEAVLSARPMPWTQVKQMTPKDIFTKILEYANEFTQRHGGGIIIQPGVVENVGATFTYDLRLSGFEHINTLCQDAGMEWNVTSEIDPKGNLLLYANLYNRLGIDTNFDLTNLNSEASAGSNIMTEQGFPMNIVIGHSQANTKEDRKSAIGTHAAAVADYGPLGFNMTFTGLRNQGEVAAAAQTYADGRGRPVKILPARRALDEGQTFANIAVGNTVNVRDNRVGFNPSGGFGFETRARIMSMKYNDMSNNAEINLEVL